MMSTLEKYRNDRNSWCELAYLESALQDDEIEDANAKQRYAILLELQYDFQQIDKEFVRYLFEQVLRCRKNQVECGPSEVFRLSAYLLARYRDPTDIPLFYRAKHLDFDAFAGGFDEEFMYWALKSGTHEYIAKHFPGVYKHYKDVKRESTFYENLELWWLAQSNAHPSNLAEEDSYELFSRCLYLGDIERARLYLQEWIKEQPKSERLDINLQYAYERLGDYPKVIELLRKQLGGIETRGWDRASVLARLLEFYVQSKLDADGFQCLRLVDEEFRMFEDWKRCGLGRDIVAKAFQYVLACNDDRSASEAFSLAHVWAKQMHWLLGSNTLETAGKAATRCGFEMEAQEYFRLAAIERERMAVESRFPSAHRVQTNFFAKGMHIDLGGLTP